MLILQFLSKLSEIVLDERSDKLDSFLLDYSFWEHIFFGLDATPEKWMTTFSDPYGLFLSSSTSQEFFFVKADIKQEYKP